MLQLQAKQEGRRCRIAAWGPCKISPLVDERVEAGEDEERQHGTESHHVGENGLQVGGRDLCDVHASMAVDRGYVMGFSKAALKVL